MLKQFNNSCNGIERGWLHRLAELAGELARMTYFNVVSDITLQRGQKKTHRHGLSFLHAHMTGLFMCNF